ncbi:MAG TPA: SdrD B-like domain-containing protein [Gemmata sp.]|nr:SdrD B-like domain-containing protein [Gemmata sp.]
MFNLFPELKSGVRRSASRPLGVACQLACESLEDRVTPTVSMITSNFNGTAIPAGDYVWFSSVAKVSGVGSAPVTLDVTNQTISFTSNGTPYTLNVPDSAIVLNPAATQASTSFGATGWSVSSPAKFSGNVFLSGLGWQAVNGLAGGSVNNITWSGNFTSNTPGISVNWQWAAAVYTEFTSNMSGIQVKTVDDNHEDVYQNSDHAGTPENFKSFVTGGARGGGGSNWTGSYSGTVTVPPGVNTTPQPGSISGQVQFISVKYSDQIIGQSGAVVTLTDSLGNVVATATTNLLGNFSFTNVQPGTYTLSISVPAGSTAEMTLAGSLGGTWFSNTIAGTEGFSGVTVGSGQLATGYDILFNEN